MKEYNYKEYYELGERLLLNGETVEVVEDGVSVYYKRPDDVRP